ncbi:MAG: universal stress protein [Planctomycetota bacterium]|jgi:nucleotide-binding universal stress UspA family protein
MQRFRNILVHVDPAAENQPGLSRAVRLAKANEGRLTVISVQEEHPPQFHALLRKLHLEDSIGAGERETQERLEQFVALARNDGIDTDVVVASGNPFVEITRTVLQSHHDLVIRTAQPEGLVRQAFFGSCDMHLLRKCPAPLWLIAADAPDRYRHILVPLDPNREDGVRQQLGGDLLQLATSLADMDDAKLSILHAWHACAEDRLRRHLSNSAFTDYAGLWQEEASRRTRGFISDFERDIRPDCIQLVHGAPGDVIPQFAHKHEVDLTVMGTLGHLGRHGVFVGDTAERILNQLECSVLAIKPVGFVSPVKAQDATSGTDPQSEETA